MPISSRKTQTDPRTSMNGSTSTNTNNGVRVNQHELCVSSVSTSRVPADYTGRVMCAVIIDGADCSRTTVVGSSSSSRSGVETLVEVVRELKARRGLAFPNEKFQLFVDGGVRRASHVLPVRPLLLFPNSTANMLVIAFFNLRGRLCARCTWCPGSLRAVAHAREPELGEHSAERIDAGSIKSMWCMQIRPTHHPSCGGLQPLALRCPAYTVTRVRQPPHSSTS
ncbi:uncharacterized protein B0H18DRAFT_1067970 [Fomitopsis serialis]|uniref:uncharacterized protein n=1 Tax=Fomitopsis serialis TaxID=139415 RepID=UPI002007655A|nr:uncharacterized protein B0H18DRAFT_1067970 [Neoantrodia serialis]KAH9910595.1 hypothetical protein B0H18DRAFT_1067970 [Neoantrodia serialis]